MAKLLFASPTYGPIDPQALKSQRVAIMHAAANGHIWVGDASPDRMKFDVARNAVAESACRSGADYVFWCDSDVVLPNYAITALIASGKDFITGIYFQRMKPHWPLIAYFNEKAQSFNWYSNWPKNVVAPVDGCGFGCVVTSVAMLREMGEEALRQNVGLREGHWFRYEKFSEDFDFCRRAARLGFQLHVDTSVLCGHLPDPEPVTIETFVAAHPEIFPANG